jgi:hypothetical protein
MIIVTLQCHLTKTPPNRRMNHSMKKKKNLMMKKTTMLSRPPKKVPMSLLILAPRNICPLMKRKEDLRKLVYAMTKMALLQVKNERTRTRMRMINPLLNFS